MYLVRDILATFSYIELGIFGGLMMSYAALGAATLVLSYITAAGSSYLLTIASSVITVAAFKVVSFLYRALRDAYVERKRDELTYKFA